MRRGPRSDGDEVISGLAGHFPFLSKLQEPLETPSKEVVLETAFILDEETAPRKAVCAPHHPA